MHELIYQQRAEMQITTAAACHVLETPPTEKHRQKNNAKQAPEKCPDGTNMVTLITSLQ
jgi:hypothetical protein